MTNTAKMLKAEREKDINKMTTGQIIWHLVFRHRVTLLIASNAVLVTYIVVSQLPIAVTHFVR